MYFQCAEKIIFGKTNIQDLERELTEEDNTSAISVLCILFKTHKSMDQSQSTDQSQMFLQHSVYSGGYILLRTKREVIQMQKKKNSDKVEHML